MERKSFAILIVTMLVVMLGGLAILVVKHNKRVEICASIGGITVQTPEGWHCLTKADFK